MTSIGDIELRSIMKFCVALEKSFTETTKMINSTGKYHPPDCPDLAPIDSQKSNHSCVENALTQLDDLVKHVYASYSLVLY